MYKKTLLSLAVASTVGLSGCFSDGGSKNAGATTAPTPTQAEQGTYPIFNPVTSELPSPNDLLFDSEAGDGSFAVDIGPADEGNPVLEALNNLSGASTVAPAVVRFNGEIDASTVDSQAFILQDPNDPTTVVPNPNQNVFLLETEYPSEEPVRALNAGESPTLPVALTARLATQGSGALTAQELEAVSELLGPSTDATRPNAGAYLAGLTSNRRFDHDVVELDGTSAIRIRPNQPLDPLKRYVVVVTDGVKTPSGDPVKSSPTYSKLSQDDEGELPNASLQSVRTLINSFWERTAGNYFQLTNNSRQGAGLDPIGVENIAVSYSFTTSEDEKVLSHIASPANWIADQVKRSVTTEAAAGAVQSGAEGFSAVREVVNTTLDNFTPSEALNDDGLQPCDGDPTYTTPLGNFEDQFQCVGALVKFGLENNANADFNQPSARDFQLTDTNRDALAVSVILDKFVDQNEVNIHQGFINLPYFLKTPGAEDGSPIRTSSWEPDSALASTIASETGFNIPQADPNTSSVLNYNFPFPERQAELDVPMLVITNDAVEAADLEDSANGYSVVLYQHGITTDRSAALAFGSSLVNNNPNLVVVAIDQPLHGVSPVSTEERLELAGSLLESTEDSAGAPEGTFNNEDLRAAVVEGEQATLETAFENAGFNQAEATATAQGLISTNSRAGSTIPGLAATSTDSGLNSGGVTERHFGYTANAENMPTQMNFDESNALGESGSLFINLTNFLNGRDNLRQGSLDLMNLRATIGNLDGVNSDQMYVVGHSLGTQTGGVFAGAAEASGNPDLAMAGVHLMTPVAGVVRLLENSPSFAPQILGSLQANGINQGDANLETFLNVNQHALDSADPINFASQLADSDTLISQINGDRTTPNAADDRYSDNVDGFDTKPLDVTFPNGFEVDAPAAPLTGSEALATLMDANSVSGSGVETPAITRYTTGAHGTPVLPEAENLEPGDIKKDRTFAQQEEETFTQAEATAVFTEMVTQTLSLIGSGSAGDDPKQVDETDGSVTQ